MKHGLFCGEEKEVIVNPLQDNGCILLWLTNNIRNAPSGAFLFGIHWDSVKDAAIEGAIQGAIGGALGLGPMGDFIQGVAWDKIVKGKSWNEAIENGIQGAIIGAGTDFALSKGNLDDFIDRTWAGIKDDVGKVKGVAKALDKGMKRLDNALRGVDDAIEDSFERRGRDVDDYAEGASCPVRLPSANSFSEDTEVVTTDGDKPISEIQAGDTVIGYDQSTGQMGEYEVTAVHVHLDKVTVNLTIDGETIETTPEHPFYTQERGWIAASALQLGEHILNLEGDYGIVEAVEVLQQPQLMYNLTVEGAHTFFVGEGSWLVHNVPPDDAQPWQYTVDPPNRMRPDVYTIGGAPAPGGRNIIPNYDYHGFNRPLPTAALREKYSWGVDYDRQGFPIFDPWVVVEVPIRHMTGGSGDFIQAERALNPNWVEGMPRVGSGDYVWHHLQDGKTMQLVPRDLHRNTPHGGGDSIMRAERKRFSSKYSAGGC